VENTKKTPFSPYTPPHWGSFPEKEKKNQGLKIGVVLGAITPRSMQSLQGVYKVSGPLSSFPDFYAH